MTHTIAASGAAGVVPARPLARWVANESRIALHAECLAQLLKVTHTREQADAPPSIRVSTTAQVMLHFFDEITAVHLGDEATLLAHLHGAAPSWVAPALDALERKLEELRAVLRATWADLRSAVERLAVVTPARLRDLAGAWTFEAAWSERRALCERQLVPWLAWWIPAAGWDAIGMQMATRRLLYISQAEWSGTPRLVASPTDDTPWPAAPVSLAVLNATYDAVSIARV